jgi:hypothetical protein
MDRTVMMQQLPHFSGTSHGLSRRGVVAGVLTVVCLCASILCTARAESPTVAAPLPSVAAPLAGQPGIPPAAATSPGGAAVDAGPAATGDEPDFLSLDDEAQALRRQVLDLNRELFLLEEELLFPTSTQVAVYVAYDVGTFFALDAVKVLVDDKEVANYLYTAREVDALQRGGVHRVWLGNLKVGRHVVTAFFNGKGPHDRDYRTGATVEVEKGVGANYLELKISDRQQKLQPEFIVKQWD